MQGFGVHTFRLVNAEGESRFVKFHWNPVAGTHSLDWDESVKIAGADPDYTRRDLWEAIESGVFPEYELGLQIFAEEFIRGFRFELTKVQVPAVRERTVSMLRNVSDELAQAVADGLGIALPKPMPRVMAPLKVEVTRSPALSLSFRPGDGSIRGRKVAILVAPGVDAGSVTRTQAALAKAGAVVRLVATGLGRITAGNDNGLEPDATFEAMPSVLFDAVVVPDGEAAAETLGAVGQVREFLRDQYRHGKAILMLGAGEKLVEAAGVPTGDASDWAMVRDLPAFIEAAGKHRNWNRGGERQV
jgi:catalase